eukprot:6274777-Heterocapsa_arctica.AAC.1
MFNKKRDIEMLDWPVPGDDWHPAQEPPPGGDAGPGQGHVPEHRLVRSPGKWPRLQSQRRPTPRL